jgi:hypothetical protein
MLCKEPDFGFANADGLARLAIQEEVPLAAGSTGERMVQ